MQSITLLLRCIIGPSSFPLPHLGFKSVMVWNSLIQSGWLRGLHLSGDHVLVQFH